MSELEITRCKTKITVKTLAVLNQPLHTTGILYEISKQAFVVLTQQIQKCVKQFLRSCSDEAFTVNELRPYKKLYLYRGYGYDDDSFFDEPDKVLLWYGQDFIVYAETR